jgi:hypothetical protein
VDLSCWAQAVNPAIRNRDKTVQAKLNFRMRNSSKALL